MFKKIMKSALVGLGMLALGSAANATVYEINMYGASAQYLFWSNADAAWMTASTSVGGLGCASADVYRAQSSDNKHAIAVCKGTDSFGGLPTGNGYTSDHHTVVFRYSSKASYDGIMAVQGLNTFNTSGCTDPAQRSMANEDTANWTAHTVTANKCVPITIGASDVKAETFAQESHGNKTGWNGTTPWIDRVVDDSSLYVDYDNYTVASNLVVPFAFYKNNGLTQLDNMPRLMAVQIFSGQVRDWNQFFGGDSNPIVVCMRHAGSGTLATLDAAVMRGDASLVTTEVNTSDPMYLAGLSPETYFQDGSGDMMKCIANKAGGIGYADSDQVYAGTTRIPYVGEEADAEEIRMGLYDFWSAQNLYYSNSLSGITSDLVQAIITYTSDSANLPASEVAYWNTTTDMLVDKSTDRAYPTRK